MARGDSNKGGKHPADKAADRGREFNKKLEEDVKRNQDEANKDARKNWS